MENNSIVRWPVFLLIVGIFITVVGAGFTILWGSLNETRREVGQVKIETTETRVKLEVLSGNISELIKRWDGYRK